MFRRLLWPGDCAEWLAFQSILLIFVSAVHVFLFASFIGLLYLATCFSALEAALFVLREKQTGLRSNPATGEASKLTDIARNPMAALPDVLLLGGIANLLLGALGLYLVLHPLRMRGWEPWTTAPVVFGVGLLLVEIVPKSIALRSPEGSLRVALPALLGVRGLFAPIARRLQGISDRWLDQAIPPRLRRRTGLMAEEVETLIEMREEQRAISSDEASVMQEILTLGALTVKDCMTPRVDLPLMPNDADEEEALRMLEGARSRFVLVFDERADAVISVIDATQWRLGRPPWRKLAKPPVFAPETFLVMDCLREHLQSATSSVVIVDEYGGLEGLLSQSNIVERLLGKAAPAQSSERAIQSLGSGRYSVSGLARIDDVNRELEVDLPTEGMDTVGGLVFTRLGYLPRPGEKLEIGSVVFKVKRTGRNRVQELELRVVDTTGEGANI